MGIIDTLTAGFDLVRRRIWLIVLPVLLDVGLWVAPRLSVSELVRRLLRVALAPPPQFSANAEWLANADSKELLQTLTLGCSTSLRLRNFDPARLRRMTISLLDWTKHVKSRL